MLGLGYEKQALIDGLSEGAELSAEAMAFAEELLTGLSNRIVDVDKALASALDGWTPERLGYMERSIMRLALFEMLFYPETPDKVAVNEAVDLAKVYCDADSHKLVNGALDKTLKGKTA